MTKRSAASVLLCFFLVFSARAQSNDKNKSLPIFSINKKPVPAEEFIYLYRKNNQDKPGQYTNEKIEEYLNLYINFKLKVEEARRRGIDTTRAFRKEYNGYREELRKPYLPDSRIVDSLVDITYKRLKEEVRTSHILINVAPDASPADTLKAYEKIIDLRNQILNGKSFAETAALYSEDPSAKLNKGDLGYFTAMQMVFPFEQAAYSTKVGEISLPVRSKFGYHIVKVTDRKPSRGEVEVSHIMLRTGEGFNNENAKNTIFDIYDKLQKGVRWEDLCKEYSQDQSSKDNGGKLRPFGVGTMSTVPEFEQNAFNLQKKGDFSDPFKTQYGWHILRLESKIPLPSFAELAPSLKNKVTRDERVQVSKQAVQAKMRRDFGFKENPEARSKVLSFADTSLNSGKWKYRANATSDNEVLFSMQGKDYSAKDFFNYVVINQKPNAEPAEKYLKQLYEQYIDEIQGQLLEEKIQKNNPDYSWLLKEYYEGIMLFEIMEKEIWNKASEDSVGQLNYYLAHASEYQAKERIKGKIFASPSNETLDQLKTLVDQQDSLKVQDFIASQKIKQESGTFEKNDKPILNKIEWKPGVFLTENNGMNYLVWVRRILPAGPKTFDEARPSVISDYQNDLEKKWIEKLKKKYPVKINKKGKQYVTKQLVKN